MTQRERFRGLVLLGFLIPLALELVGVLQAVAGLLGFP